jgi:5-methylcytosine-specific restriction endonuclease McrA
MSALTPSQLSDHALLRELGNCIQQDRETTARMLGYLAEVDARRLYLPAGYPSMYAYLVGAWNMSEGTAFKRIRVARAAKEFPAIIEALAAGQLNLNAVMLLAPYLSVGTAADLLSAAANKNRSEIEHLVAQRFPRPDLATMIQPMATQATPCQLAARPVSLSATELGMPDPVAPNEHHAVTPTVPDAVRVPASPAAPVAPARIATLAPQRFGIQVTVDQETHDLLRYAQALLGHTVPSSDVAQVLNRALTSLVQELEKHKLGAGSKSRPAARRRSRPATGKSEARYIPTAVRRTVWERDQGRCTFVSRNGKRCDACTRLEFDHVTPVARGGLSTASNLRLSCRAHNQHAAEGVYGSAFMRGKRERARRSPEISRSSV